MGITILNVFTKYPKSTFNFLKVNVKCFQNFPTIFWKFLKIFKKSVIIFSKISFSEIQGLLQNGCWLSPDRLVQQAIHLSQNTRKWAWNAKNKKCIAEYFVPLFSRFAPLFSLFAFHSILRQGWHSHKESNDFVVYFFAALIKHEIRAKSV